MISRKGQDNQQSVRIDIIQTVQTPLGFFTLVVLVVEVVLGIGVGLSQGTDRTILIWGMLALIFLLVAIVAVSAFFRPEALSGIRPTHIAASIQPTIGIESNGQDHIVEPPLAAGAIPPLTGPHRIYSSIDEATPAIISACKDAEAIKVLANKGIRFIGTDESIVSTAEIGAFKNLRKIRVILMARDSHWINKGFIKLRRHESLEVYLKDLDASHLIVESGLRKFASQLPSTRSGVKYFSGEPHWRMIMTEKTVFVSNYADANRPQVRDLTVAQFDNVDGSFYSAFKRHFDDVWHNQSKPGDYMQETMDFSVSAGGIIYAEVRSAVHVLLLIRHDGSYVLPKGHKQRVDISIEDTALREVSEETGIPASYLRVERQLEVYTDTEHEPKVVHLFAIRYLGADLLAPKPDVDHAAARWWPITDSIPYSELL